MRKRRDRGEALVCFWFGGVALLLTLLVNVFVWSVPGPSWLERFAVGFASLGAVAFSIARFVDAFAYWDGE